MNALTYIIPSLLLGIAIGYAIKVLMGKLKIKTAEVLAQQIIEEAKREAETQKKELLLEAKDQIHKERQKLEDEFRLKKQELSTLERRLLQKEENLEKRIDTLDKKERMLLSKEREILQREEEIKKAYDKHIKELEKIAQMSAEEAKNRLIKEMEEEAKIEATQIINKIEEEARVEGEKKAREILLSVIQRNAVEVTSETTVVTVQLPNDDMKGRIIGREGRNIRTLESITGVDVIIDDTPEVVLLSSFDPVRREIARRTLEKLIQDGRIHPARIEDIHDKVTKEVNRIIREEGEKAVQELKIQGFTSEEIEYIGRLKFRSSYGQNVLEHSKEVANIAGMIAAEIGANVEIAKRAGLLHDIGKGVQTIGEGGHALVGAEIAKKLGESDWVVNIIASHHGEVEPKSIEAIIVQVADAISASRPGARRETFESYLHRLEQLEKIASSFEGVEKAYAIQAGREIRVFVQSDVISDEKAQIIARDIARKIEKEMKYPGQIKVTLIRETRIVEYAR